jgi:hypothetical protein
MRDEKIGTAQIKVLEVEQIDVPSGTIAQFVGIDESGLVVRSSEGGGGGEGGEVADGSITTAKLANDAVTVDKIADNAVESAQIAGLAVTTGKIASNAVTSGKLDTGAVTTAKIADANVTLAKLENISQNHLIGRHSAGSGVPQQIGLSGGLEISGANIRVADGGITQAKLSATGAGAGKVLTTDGSSMTWETPSGGSTPVGTANIAFNSGAANPSTGTYSQSFGDYMYSVLKDYTPVLVNTRYPINSMPNLRLGVEPSTTILRDGVCYAGGRYYFCNNSASHALVGLHYTTDFTSFGNEDNDYANAFQRGAGTEIWTDTVNDACALTLIFGARAQGFLVNNAGVWSLVKLPLISSKYYIGLFGSNNNITYQSGVLTAFFSGTGLNTRAYTSDLGNTWTACTNPPASGQTIHRTANNILYSTNGSTSIKFSTDNGLTWTDGTTLPASVTSSLNHCMDFNGTNYVLAAQGTNTVWTTTSLTGSWTSRTSAFTTSNPKNVFWCGDLFIATSTASQTNYAISSTDGVTWTQRTGANAFIPSIALKVGSRYVVSGNGRTERTANIGTNFTSLVAAGVGGLSYIYGECVQRETNIFAFHSGIAAAVYHYNGLTDALTTVTNSQFVEGYLTMSATITETRVKYK